MMKKKILTLMTAVLAIMMTLSFSGCGGSGDTGDEKASQSGGTETGIQNILFTSPEGWERDGVSEGAYSSFSNPDFDSEIGVSSVDKDNLESFADITVEKTLEEFYKNRIDPPAKKTDYNLFSGKDLDKEQTQICGEDATSIKVKKDDGYVEIATYCMIDDVVYDFYITRHDAYDENNEIVSKAKVLSEEELAAYNSLLESVKAGDGSGLQMKGISTDRIGEASFAIPEGYEISGLEKKFASFENDSKVELSISCVDEEELKYMYDENGKSFKSLKALFDDSATDSESKAKIAGVDGYKSDVLEGDSYLDAQFMTEEAVYFVNMITEDESSGLSKDDIAAFDAFLDSIQLK